MTLILCINPKLMTKEQLQEWLAGANWHSPAEYTVARVAAESLYATELAVEWIESQDELVAVSGWSTYANYVSIAPDESLDIEEIRAYLIRVRDIIHSERNWVRYVMNTFVISVGVYVEALTEEARSARCMWTSATRHAKCRLQRSTSARSRRGGASAARRLVSVNV